MNILHVTGMPFPTKYGSLEKWFVELCKYSTSKNSNVYISYSKGIGDVVPYSKEIDKNDGRLVVLENDSSIINFCIENKIKIVHFHFDFVGHKSLYTILHKSGIKLYAYLHCENCYYVNSKWKRNFKLWFRINGHRLKMWYTSRFFEQIFACSKQVKLENKKMYHWSNKKLSVMYLGLQKESTNLISKEYNSDVPVIACTAFHSPIKGIDVLLKALKILDSKQIEFKLIEIGGGSAELNGEDTEQLIQLSDRLGIRDKIEWVGITNDVYGYLKKADIYCQPSRTEALSLSIAEAMQCKLPIVASKIGGIPELVFDGRNGFTVPVDKPDALAEALIKLIENESLRINFGTESLSILEEIDFYQQESVKKIFSYY